MSKQLRVTIIGLNYSPEPSGNAPYTTALAEGLTLAGHKVSVITGFPHYPEWSLKDGYSGWKRKEIVNGVNVIRLRHHIPSKPNSISRLHMELSFGVRVLFAKWHKPDVVLTISPALLSSALAIVRARFRTNRPAVAIWVQDLYSRGVVETGTGGSRLGKMASDIESRILRSADGVSAIHDRFKKHMVEILGVPADDVRVIRNWTHLPASPKVEVAQVREAMGWAPDEVIVLHAGNMGKKQGLENVLEAARVAESRGSRVRFVLMGDGNQRKILELKAVGLSRINIVDSLPGLDFQRALASANILLVNELPGVKDMAVPSKLTSYFSAGVPVIAATEKDSVTAFEITSSGGGVRVEPTDPTALVEMAEALSCDPARTAELAANGLRYRHDILSEATAVSHYDGFITSLASSRGR